MADVDPDEHTLQHARAAAASEEVREQRARRATMRPATRCNPGRSATRARAAARSRSSRSGPGSGRPRRGGCPRTAGAARPCARTAPRRPRPARARRRCRPSAHTSPGGRARAASGGGRRSRSSRSGSSAPSTRKPQKTKACISPGQKRCSSLRWPSTIVTSLRTRARHVARTLASGRAALTSAVRRETRRANSVPLTPSAAASATASNGETMRPSPSGSRPRSRAPPRAGCRSRRSRRARRSTPRRPR